MMAFKKRGVHGLALTTGGAAAEQITGVHLVYQAEIKHCLRKAEALEKARGRDVQKNTYLKCYLKIN